MIMEKKNLSTNEFGNWWNNDMSLRQYRYYETTIWYYDSINPVSQSTAYFHTLHLPCIPTTTTKSIHYLKSQKIWNFIFCKHEYVALFYHKPYKTGEYYLYRKMLFENYLKYVPTYVLSYQDLRRI